ncbi:MAG: sulfotransferase [Pseudomonadota bacterium]
MFRRARQTETKGDLAKARAEYEAILGMAPDSAEVRFQLGQLLLKMQTWRDALTHLQHAAKLRPKEKVIWQAQAAALRAIGDPAENQAFLARAKKARIDAALLVALTNALQPTATRNEGIGSAAPRDLQVLANLIQQGKNQEAASRAARLSQKHPDSAAVRHLQAKALARLGGKASEADTAFKDATRIAAGYVAAHADYGRFLIQQAQYADAIQQLTDALRLHPKHVDAAIDLARAFRFTNRLSAAERALDQVLKGKPDLAAAKSELAQVYLSDNRPVDAAEILRDIVEGQHPTASQLTVYARALALLNQNDAAARFFDRAIETAPRLIEPRADKAHFLQQQGSFDDAAALFETLIAENPRIGQHYHSYVTTKKVSPGDDIIARMEAQFAAPALSPINRSYFGFALAKALEDTKQYERVFTYLKPANDLVRAQFPYDVQERLDTVGAIETAFEHDDFEIKSDGSGPIFVSGLPRSGTTLVEQILASHSRVTGGGELGFAVGALVGALRRKDGTYRRWADVSQNERRALAKDVDAKMNARFKNAEIVTDKSVQSYALIGPILATWPGAKLVVVHRDPRDALLSMYRNRFADGTHLYSYDLRDLGHYFHAFTRSIEFWREKLGNQFIEIRYEDLVRSPEKQTRALIAQCGLAWEDACLAFHENKRRVETLSIHQVRQPIYRSSVNAWERYGSALQPLLDALGPPYDS